MSGKIVTDERGRLVYHADQPTSSAIAIDDIFAQAQADDVVHVRTETGEYEVRVGHIYQEASPDGTLALVREYAMIWAPG